MRKKTLLVLSLILVLSMVLVACGGKDSGSADELNLDEAVTLNVWSFTNEIQTMAIAFEGKYPNVDVVYTMIPMTDGEYQTKIKAAIGTEDVPDVVALEAAFVKEWVEADFLANLNDLLPLTEELQTYPSVVEVGTYDGVTKAYSYQATPGAYEYRRSIATECLGTDDPDQVQAMVADLDKFLETAPMATTTWSAPLARCSTPSWPTAPSRGS